MDSRIFRTRFPAKRCGWDAPVPLLSLLLVLLAVLAPGCGLLRAPEKVMTTVTPSGGSKPTDPIALQLQLQRYTDDFLRQSSLALDEYAARAGTEAARFETMRLKLAAGFSVISIASGPSPAANLVDLVTVSVLTRRTIEDYWIQRSDGSAFARWLAASRTLETNIWQIAATTFKPEQVQELRDGIDQWYRQNPEVRTAFLARPQEVASIIQQSAASKGKESVFSLASLDPMAGLDPAVREIAQSRLFAERALFTLQRLPPQVRLQTELLTYELSQQSEIRTALTNLTRASESADRLSRAFESVSQTAAQLPDRLSTERAAILEELDQQEGKLRELAAETGRTLATAEKMSGSLTVTITHFDALMKRFGVGEPGSGPAPGTNAAPFRILDYAETADRIGGMARDLNALIAGVDQALPQVERLGEQAGADARRLADHVFRQGVILIAVFLGGAVAAGLLYRVLARRLAPGGQPPAPAPRQP